MNRLALLVSVSVACSAGVAVGLGCSSSSGGSGPSNDAGGGGDVTMGDDGGGGSDGGTSDAQADADAGPPVQVSFAYKPQWTGVKKVDVVGGFGMTSDWSKKQSFLSLSDDGTGNWKGTGQLPAGTYLYVFRVVGDDDTTQGAAYERYAIDPLETGYAPCPMASPTYSKIDANPCSQVTVPQGQAAAPVHVKGSLVSGGTAANGWIVVAEREEKKSHHFFVNRVTTGADGSFDLVASAGSYRLQAQHPAYYKSTDIQIDPTQAKTLRRAISNAFPLMASDITVTAPDLAFDLYGQFAPTGGSATLPTAFTFQSDGPSKLDVYGGPGDGGVVEIGDPWYASTPTVDGGSSFDGVFNTPQAGQDAAVLGTRYMWGTEEGYDASVTWTKQTMVFPITWQ
jgi:hypothetical protein